MQKYFTLKPLMKINPPWQFAVLIGERSNGKSYAVKNHVLREYKKNGTRFIYLRRYQIETKPSYVEGYFRDAPVGQIFSDEWEFITCYRGGIYLSRYNEETGKTDRGDLVGYTAWLSGETHFKSINYNDVTSIIMEEITTADGYLYNEVQKLESFVSTVARRRAIRVFLVGNTISRLCPYFSEFGIDVKSIKQGTISIYDHETDQKDDKGNPVVVRVALCFCENSGNNSKMFFGTSSKMITSGAWQTKSYPHLPFRYRECRPIYAMLYEYKEFVFKFEVLKTPAGLCVFIHPHTTSKEGFRMITDRPSIDMKHSREFSTLVKGDALVKTLYDYGKVYYSDNLTGEDFHSIIADKGGL